MLLRNIIFALRNFRRRKLFSVVNVIGLTISITAAGIIFLYILNELSFDRFNTNYKRIARVYETFTWDGSDQAWIQVPMPYASFLQNKYPQIEKTARIVKVPKGLVVSGAASLYEDRIILADTTVFDIFTLPFVEGNPKTALSSPGSIVLTQKTAEKYFGKTDAFGKTLTYSRNNTYTVTGIIRDIPETSHLIFDMMIPLSEGNKLFGPDFADNRMNTVAFTYLLANKSVDFDELDKAVSASTKDYEQGDFGDKKLYHIQSLASIHLLSAFGGEYSVNGDYRTIIILATIALLIIITACINYINLTYSISIRRTTELGIRKILGAGKAGIFMIYFIEAALVTGLSLIISTLILGDCSRLLSSYTGSPVSYNGIGRVLPWFGTIFLFITLVTGFLSGRISSGAGPAEIFRKSVTHKGSGSKLQGTLVLIQFVISIVLITCTIFIYRQMQFIRDANLGFSKEQLMIIPLNDRELPAKISSLKNEIATDPGVISSSAISDLPGQMLWVTTIHYEGQSPDTHTNITYLETDRDFMKTFGVKLVEGFMPGDTACRLSGTHYLINESAAKMLGWDKPVGKSFSCYTGKDGFVTGVFRDFNFKSLRQKIEPMFVFIREKDPYYFTVRLNGSDIVRSVTNIQSVWKKLFPGSPFEYFFYDSYYDQLYKKESSFGRLIMIFSALAIFIACLGLFGLAAYFSESKTKETGIRKVNGATIPSIVFMLNANFVKWVLFAFVIATPIAWFFMNKWLSVFAYHIKLSFWVFIMSGLTAFIISLLTVSWQSYRSASVNPVESLRYE